MAAISPPVKFVGELNPFLLCPMCRNVLQEPAINVRCGHSFCRRCLEGCPGQEGDVKCPVDGAVCDSESVVVNRSVLSAYTLQPTENLLISDDMSYGSMLININIKI